MENTSILATQMGIGEESLIGLYASVADSETSARIGISQSSLQEFLHGVATDDIADRLGLTADGLQEVLNRIGNNGAIGMVIARMLLDRRIRER